MKDETKLIKLIDSVIHQMIDAGYNESTVKGYRNIFERLQQFAVRRKEEYYSIGLGKAFLNDRDYDIPENSKRYIHERYSWYCRCIKFMESYINTGTVDFTVNYSGKSNYPPLKYPALCVAEQAFHELTRIRGLKSNTRDGYHRLVRYFLKYLEEKGYSSIQHLKSGDVVAFIIFVCEENYSATSLGAHLPGLRLFLTMDGNSERFENELPDHLPRKQNILQVYDVEEIEKIQSYIGNSDISSRNKAITLLALETGLRAVDICGLKLTDIDWKHNCILITQKKTGRPLNIPLKESFGNALVDYLILERHTTTSEYVFMEKVAPYRPLTSHSACRLIIKEIVDNAGIIGNGRIYGTRITRHSMASSMLKQGVPFPVIAEALGHGNPNSSMIYIATDNVSLAGCTLALPKGGRNDE
jgi:site-specific recombinase XerD